MPRLVGGPQVPSGWWAGPRPGTGRRKRAHPGAPRHVRSVAPGAPAGRGCLAVLEPLAPVGRGSPDKSYRERKAGLPESEGSGADDEVVDDDG